MDLFVIRHAVAADAKADEEDAARALTPEGARKFRRCVKGLRELGWHFDRVITSPWTRALQTTKLLEPLIEGPTMSTELLTDKPRSELFALIAEATGPQSKKHATAVVGHEPWLTELIGWLVFSAGHHGDGIKLKKGGMAWLQGSAVPGGMKLRALFTPKMLRALR